MRLSMIFRRSTECSMFTSSSASFHPGRAEAGPISGTIFRALHERNDLRATGSKTAARWSCAALLEGKLKPRKCCFWRDRAPGEGEKLLHGPRHDGEDGPST